MTNVDKLITEIQSDPVRYNPLTDQQLVDDLNSQRGDTRNKSSLSGDDLFKNTDDTEFAGLTDHKRGIWVSWCNTDRDPFDTANVAFVLWVFGGGSTTISNLSAARVEAITRAQLIGVGTATLRDVARARLIIAGG
jgi:hypothetical protein